MDGNLTVEIILNRKTKLSQLNVNHPAPDRPKEVDYLKRKVLNIEYDAHNFNC